MEVADRPTTPWSSAILREVAAGEVLVHEGGRDDDVFTVVEGSFEILRGPAMVCIDTVGPGATIGEIAALAGCPRTATVRPSAPATTSASSVRCSAFPGRPRSAPAPTSRRLPTACGSSDARSSIPSQRGEARTGLPGRAPCTSSRSCTTKVPPTITWAMPDDGRVDAPYVAWSVTAPRRTRRDRRPCRSARDPCDASRGPRPGAPRRKQRRPTDRLHQRRALLPPQPQGPPERAGCARMGDRLRRQRPGIDVHPRGVGPQRRHCVAGDDRGRET